MFLREKSAKIFFFLSAEIQVEWKNTFLEVIHAKLPHFTSFKNKKELHILLFIVQKTHFFEGEYRE